ncbi:hypothetical protein FRX31_008447 [Thalictrum thalictroides]|uniref:Uncharacterized protein n=1 Tax=Thalictrum thalictroides TaxID=46969 RepID=A0A7J6WX06_THATH|nr:hypothetical protein FRX31_008447 [Thalictrum thalictroides]
MSFDQGNGPIVSVALVAEEPVGLLGEQKNITSVRKTFDKSGKKSFSGVHLIMSGAGKKVADVAVIATKGMDWDGMAKLLVSEEARKDEVNHTLQTFFF